MEAQSTSPEFFGATLAWNGEGWNLALRNGMVLVYGENAPLQEIRDSHGNTVRIIRMYQNAYGNYDGPITQVISPNGYWMALTWDNYDNPSVITKVTDNAGRSVSYAYDSNGNLHTVTDPDGRVTTYGYDSDNRLTTIIDPNGTTYLTNTYNSSRRLTSQVVAGQGTYTFSYSSGSAKVTEPDGTTRDLAYDSNGYLASDERAAGTTSAHEITVVPDTASATGELPGSVSDGLGRTTSTSYDSSGDDLSGDGTAEDGLGEDSCTTDPNSFAASTQVTQVTLASGRTEPISDVKPGDEVQATDPVTGKTSPEPVLAVIKGHKTEHLVTLTIRADVHGRMHTGMIVATTGHLIYDLTRHAWVTAGHLHPGDQLDALGGTAAVTAIRGHAPHEATAYNLTVSTDHTYYVATASTAVLVHNCDGEYITDEGLIIRLMDTPSSGSAEIPRAALILRSGQAWWSGRPRAIRSCLGHRAVPPRGCIWRGSRANGLRYNSAEKQVKWLLPSCRTKPNLEQF